MKLLIVSGFKPLGTEWGVVEGLEANGHELGKIPTVSNGVRHPDFAQKVLSEYESGEYDTILMCKGGPIPLGTFKEIARKADVTYWCNDSVSGKGCGPPQRPEDVGTRGLLCDRIICTGSEGARWWRQNGYKGRMAQIYQGCRHSIWRPANLDRARTEQDAISFLGSFYRGDGGRRAKFKALGNAGFRTYTPRRTFHEKASELYYDSGICLNMVCGTPGEGACPVGITSNRLVRILTSGGFALSERNTDVEHTFEDGNQLAMTDFSNIPQLVEKARYYMERPKDRLEIARRGWEWSQDWGWDQQTEKMVRFIDGEDVPADGAAGEYTGRLEQPTERIWNGQ